MLFPQQVPLFNYSSLHRIQALRNQTIKILLTDSLTTPHILASPPVMASPIAGVLDKHITKLEFLATNFSPTHSAASWHTIEILVQDFWAFRTHFSFGADPDFGQRASRIKQMLEPHFPALALAGLADFVARQCMEKCKAEDQAEKDIERVEVRFCVSECEKNHGVDRQFRNFCMKFSRRNTTPTTSRAKRDQK